MPTTPQPSGPPVTLPPNPADPSPFPHPQPVPCDVPEQDAEEEE